jgi:2-polyprenyl-3-methyl-5-hydroxy-6-metoxy-1,4-benzoquinol methylase
MPLFLSKRNTGITEWMDREDCDKQLLFNTYSQFDLINRLLSGWGSLYQAFIKPLLLNADSEFTILDIGCGGGDIIRYLNRLCLKDDLEVRFTGIEPDSRAIEYLDQSDRPDNITYRFAHSSDLIKSGETFDLVISNHLMHHLSRNGLLELCADAEKLASKRVLFSDIERSDVGYLSFMMAAPVFFRNSYIVKDGLISIRRSYRKHELEHVLPSPWQVKRKVPFRLVAHYDKL